MILLQMIFGFVFLAFGGDVLVRNAVGVANNLRVPHTIVGIVLVGFGTSIPELATNLEAVLINAPALAIGTVLGSNIANILLVLGAAALVAHSRIAATVSARDAAMLLFATSAFATCSVFLSFTRGVGVFFVCILIYYLIITCLYELASSTGLKKIIWKKVNPDRNLNGALRRGDIYWKRCRERFLFSSARDGLLPEPPT